MTRPLLHPEGLWESLRACPLSQQGAGAESAMAPEVGPDLFPQCHQEMGSPCPDWAVSVRHG